VSTIAYNGLGKLRQVIAIGRVPPAQFAALHRRHAGDASQPPESQ
jgi:hypothetical protein